MTTVLEIEPTVTPLTTNERGIVFVAGTRVTLDTVAEAFDEGCTAEEIVQQYPTLSLTDVYAVIAYYLRHKSEVTAYLEKRRVEGETLRARLKTRFDQAGVRERLLERQRQMREAG